MAAPLMNTFLRCRHAWCSTFPFKYNIYSSISICGMKTSVKLNKKRTNSFSVHKLEKMMTKKKKKFYFDPMNTSQLGKMTSSGLQSKKRENRLEQHDSVKLRIYNTILYGHVVDLVNSNYISDELEQLQVPVLAVRMAGDMSVARVYWQASGSTENDDKVQAVLDRYTGRVRHALISLRVLGNVPRVCFLKDKAAANIAEIDHLLAAADLGPSEDEDDINEIDPRDMAWNNPFSETLSGQTGSGHFKRGGVDETKDDVSQTKYKGPSYFAVDHADVFEQILNRRKKEESVDTAEGFSPITDSVEQFRKFQKRRSVKKRDTDDDTLYRGQLDGNSLNDSDEYYAQDTEDSLGDFSGDSDLAEEDEMGDTKMFDSESTTPKSR